MLPCISNDVLVSPQHLSLPANHISGESSGVSLLSPAPAPSLTDGPSLWLLFVFCFFCFFLPSCVGSRGLCHPIRTSKAAKSTPPLPVNVCESQSWHCLWRISGETKHFYSAEVAAIGPLGNEVLWRQLQLGRGVYYAAALTGAVIWAPVIELIFMMICRRELDVFPPETGEIKVFVSASDIRRGSVWSSAELCWWHIFFLLESITLNHALSSHYLSQKR